MKNKGKNSNFNQMVEDKNCKYPKEIHVGEVRGEELEVMLEAMSKGHPIPPNLHSDILEKSIIQVREEAKQKHKIE